MHQNHNTTMISAKEIMENKKMVYFHALIASIVSLMLVVLVLTIVLFRRYFIVLSVLETEVCMFFVFLYPHYQSSHGVVLDKLRFFTALSIVVLQFVLFGISIPLGSVACYALVVNPPLIVGYVLYSRKLLARAKAAALDLLQVEIEVALPKKFDISELETATQNFEHCVGKGGYGSVFKGTLPDDREVAVKRMELQKVSSRESFVAEVNVIAESKHDNLVRLIGYCIAPDFAYLVYEFMKNLSLKHWVFEEDGATRRSFTVSRRYQVAIDVANALKYLHTECSRKILHFDIKPENILLNEDFRALVGDFGVSRLLQREQTSYQTTLKGTYGYVAPEFLNPRVGDVSDKSDVYSYGLVLLEMVSGKRNFSNGEGDLFMVHTINRKLLEGRLMDVVDKSFGFLDRRDEERLEMLAKLGFLCTQQNPLERPNMVQVIAMLEGSEQVPLAQEIPTYKHLGIDGTGSYVTMGTGDSTVNAYNTTWVSGR